MKRITGIVKEVYIPIDNKIDVMYSNKIGFVIEVDNKLYKYETDQDEETADIMKDDNVEVIIQVIDNHKFIDVRRLDGEF